MAEQKTNAEIPFKGRVAGIDYGTVRIGVAITDYGQRIASPLENYNRRNPQLDDRFFVHLASNEQIVGFVIGLPVHTNGLESQKSIEARAFGNHLAKLTGLPVAWYDERYTSAIAEELLIGAGLTSKRRKARLDKIAAQILLTSWLESSRKSESSQPIEDEQDSTR